MLKTEAVDNILILNDFAIFSPTVKRRFIEGNVLDTTIAKASICAITKCTYEVKNKKMRILIYYFGSAGPRVITPSI